MTNRTSPSVHPEYTRRRAQQLNIEASNPTRLLQIFQLLGFTHIKVHTRTHNYARENICDQAKHTCNRTIGYSWVCFRKMSGVRLAADFCVHLVSLVGALVVGVCLHGGDVGVHQNHLDAFLLQGLDSLIRVETFRGA